MTFRDSTPGPMKVMPAFVQGAGKVDVLAQEAVARVHGLGAGVAAGLDDGLDLQVALGRGGGADPHGDVGFAHVAGAGVGVAVDGHRTDAQGAQGADHAAGDLAAVGDEDGAEQRLLPGRGKSGRRRNQSWLAHIRNRPKEVSGSGVRETTSSASPRTVRVSAGSITPSSQRRAVE